MGRCVLAALALGDHDLEAPADLRLVLRPGHLVRDGDEPLVAVADDRGGDLVGEGGVGFEAEVVEGAAVGGGEGGGVAFGFEAGAFTDAKRAKLGLFEAASGGTLFLDEIDSLSPAVQGKVLKAIEEKQVRRLGEVESRHIDVKLVTATQSDETTSTAQPALIMRRRPYFSEA